jgi:hypothetical protein
MLSALWNIGTAANHRSIQGLLWHLEAISASHMFLLKHVRRSPGAAHRRETVPAGFGEERVSW